MLVVQLFGRDCVVLAGLRVAPIRSRTASVALIAFSVLALMPTLVHVAVLAFFNIICKFDSVMGCVSIVRVLVNVALLPVFHFIQLRFFSISVRVVSVVKRVAVFALQFQFVSGLCCAQLWLHFLSVVPPSSFCGLGNGNLHL